MATKNFRFLLISGVLFCLSFVAFSRTYFESAHAKEKEEPKMEKIDPSSPQGPKIIDLGDGVTLEERNANSENNSLRITEIRHNGKKMFSILCNKTTDPKSKNSFSRGFWHDDKPVLSEEDTNGDSIPDTLILYDEKPLPWKAFQEKPDGVLIPMSDEKVEQMRKKAKVVFEIMSLLLEEAKKNLEKE